MTVKMSDNEWRQTILDRLRERNKHESGFQEIINHSESLLWFFRLVCFATM